MPVTKTALRRYRIIDKAINNKYKKWPSKEELLSKLKEALDKSVSPSTLDKDIRDMREDEELGYLAPIHFNKTKGGYEYKEPGYSIHNFPVTDEDMEAIRLAAETLEQFSDIPVFRQFQDAIKKINEKLKMTEEMGEEKVNRIVMFESTQAFSGVDHIGTLLSAIREKQQVKFDYENIYKGKTQSYTVDPYLLKEYRNRWYLISYSAERKDFLTFGLDRATNMEVLRTTYKRRKEFDADVFFKHSIGITEFSGKPENIVLEFSPVIGKLIKSQPLHASQKIISDAKAGLKISINVFLSEDLLQIILSYGPNVKVLKPEKVVKEVKKRLDEGLSRY